jgi:hypothetical protein
MSVVCEYCTKTYSNKSNLRHHQKTAKKCLRIQQREVAVSFTCSGCCSTFTRKDHLRNHLAICAPYIREQVEIELSEEYEYQLIDKDEEIQRLYEEIQRLRKKNKDLEKRPQNITINNNTTNNILNFYADRIEDKFTHKNIEKHVPTLKLEDVRAPRPLAVWSADKLQNIILCSDKSRYNFIYKDSMDQLIRDPRFRKGIHILFSAISLRAQELLTKYLLELPPYSGGERPAEDRVRTQIQQMKNMILELGGGKISPNKPLLCKFLAELGACTYAPLL